MTEEQMIVHISAYQLFANYKNPWTQDHPETLPLPYRSMIIGLLQKAVGDYYGHKSKINWKGLDVAVFGNYISKFRHYIWHHPITNTGSKFYIKDKKLVLSIENKGIHVHIKAKKADPHPIVLEELFSINLHFFIRVTEDFGNDLVSNLKDSLFFLGKADDVLFIESIDVLPIEKLRYCKKTKTHTFRYGGWLNLDSRNVRNYTGYKYRLPLHINYYINMNTLAKNRSQILFYRNIGRKEVIWGNYIYIPPYSEFSFINQSKCIAVPFGSDYFEIFDEMWFNGFGEKNETKH